MLIINYEGEQLKNKSYIATVKSLIIHIVEIIKAQILIWRFRKNPDAFEEYMNQVMSEIRDWV